MTVARSRTAIEAIAAIEAIEAWMRRMHHARRRAYASDLKLFADWIHYGDAGDDYDAAIAEALISLHEASPSAVTRTLECYQSDLKEMIAPSGKPLSVSTIKRRVSTVNAALREIQRNGNEPDYEIERQDSMSQP